MAQYSAKAFTLAELLIALLILGQIATFTIPKVLHAQASGRNNAIAKEVISTVASAHRLAQLNGTLTTSSTLETLTPYMNYVAIDATSTIDGVPSGAGSMPCTDPTYKCLRLHSGALVLYAPGTTFATTDGFLSAIIDADGRLTSQSDSLGMVLYYNGRVEDYEGFTGSAAYTPTWFSWQ